MTEPSVDNVFWLGERCKMIVVFIAHFLPYFLLNLEGNNFVLVLSERKENSLTPIFFPSKLLPYQTYKAKLFFFPFSRLLKIPRTKYLFNKEMKNPT